MARFVLGIGAALAAAGLAAPVAAQSVDDDVRCLLASNFFARTEKNAQQKQIAMASAAFYLGRLDARISNEQLNSAAMAQAKTMTKDSLGPTMNSCAKRLIQKGIAQHNLGASSAPRKPAPPAKPK
ncbi:MAG TPA: hypothetical protein VK533_02735 [Sphingomonas sp.]|uniref:hypothetical protein n=1 Tax=Sphingomonas sp. TaxID=28214 RepID=UPI002BEFEBC8|nr:hypothetical protein [Sphingomonas sp.]HMI18440.1 hypothetical protein [Sphingomonas sp.]